MKQLFAIILFISSTICLGQVSSVSFDYDTEVDFTQFKTFNFTENTDNLPISDLNQKRLINGVETALQNKGFSKSEEPDVLIDIQIYFAEKKSFIYDQNYNYLWRTSFTTTTIDVSEYLEGTIFIDMIDTKTNRLIWQGRGIGAVNPEVSAKKREKRIDKGLNKIFKKYPPQ